MGTRLTRVAGLMLGLSLLSGGTAVMAQTPTTVAQSTGAPVVGAPLLEPAIDVRRAQEIALEGQTGAVVTEVSLGGETGVLAYSIELDNGMEVDVDAASGDVLKTEQVSEDSDDGAGNGESEDENGTEDENGAEGEEENGSEEG